MEKNTCHRAHDFYTRYDIFRMLKSRNLGDWNVYHFWGGGGNFFFKKIQKKPLKTVVCVGEQQQHFDWPVFESNLFQDQGLHGKMEKHSKF